jgi:aminoglycoside/choline kinase family phosphotransferase
VTPPPAPFLDFLRSAFRRRFGADAAPGEPAEIGRGGSRRRYFRLGAPPRSLVGLLSPDPPADPRGVTENDAFLYVARHLSAAGADVPAVHESRLPEGWFALEDIGPTLLYDVYRQAGHSPGVRSLYGAAVRRLAAIHTWGTPGFDPRRTHNPDWDAAFARQHESGYFQRSFLRGWLGWEPDGLDADLDRLAQAVSACWEPCFLYRDFQSQNIAVQGDRLRFFDFQGARHGPRQYDLASLLCDPYVELPAGWQAQMIDAYIREAAALDPAFDGGRFAGGWPVVAAHRLMQALGAYGHLSTAAGKPWFQAHVPAAARLLSRLLEQSPALRDYPALSCCVDQIPGRAARRLGMTPADPAARETDGG